MTLAKPRARTAWKLFTAGAPARAGMIGAVMVVLAGAGIGWLSTGVTLGQVAVFLGYHAAFVVAPGWLLYRAIRPVREGGLRQLVFGWALGYLVEILSFVATAAAGHRGLMPVLVLLVGVCAAAVWCWRARSVRDSEATPIHPPAVSWVLAGVCLLALLIVVIDDFLYSPLPGHVRSISYGFDKLWMLSLAAEALHHWPVSDPTVSGEPLYYHLFATFDAAASAQVTGIALPVVFFRLCVVPLVVLALLSVATAAEMVTRRIWAGPVAACSVFLVGGLNINPNQPVPFLNLLPDTLVTTGGTGFTMGAAFLMLAVLLLYEIYDLPKRASAGAPKLVLIALLLVGCVGAKSPILPVVTGGLAVHWLWRATSSKIRHRGGLEALGIAVGVLVLGALLYSGAGQAGTIFHPPGTISQMRVFHQLFPWKPGTRSVSSAAWWLAAIPVGIVGAYGPSLAGLLARFGRQGAPTREGDGLVFAMLATALVPYLLVTISRVNQTYFTSYAVMGASLLSAGALCHWWEHRVLDRMWVKVGSVWVLAATGVGVVMAYVLHVPAGKVDPVFDAVDLALAAAATLVLGMVVLRRIRARSPVCLVVALVSLGAAAQVLVNVALPVKEVVYGQRLFDSDRRGMTTGLYAGLRWIEEHTASGAVIAVNNPTDWHDGWPHPGNFYYTAFAERRTFLEGWIYTQRSLNLGLAAVQSGAVHPYAFREKLNTAVFARADPKALHTMVSHYGVRYLLVSRLPSAPPASPRLARLGRAVYANRDVTIYSVK